MKEPQSMIEAMEELREALRELALTVAEELRIPAFIRWFENISPKWQSIVHITLRAILLLVVLLTLIELVLLVALLAERTGWLQ